MYMCIKTRKSCELFNLKQIKNTSVCQLNLYRKMNDVTLIQYMFRLQSNFFISELSFHC